MPDVHRNPTKRLVLAMNQVGQHVANVLLFRRALNIANLSFASGLHRFVTIRLCGQVWRFARD
jgi:hypothetical protein